MAFLGNPAVRLWDSFRMGRHVFEKVDLVEVIQECRANPVGVLARTS